MVHLSPRSTKQESIDRSCSLGIYLLTGTGSRGINSSSPSRAHFGVGEDPPPAHTTPSPQQGPKLCCWQDTAVGLGPCSLQWSRGSASISGTLGPMFTGAGTSGLIYWRRGSPRRRCRGAGATAESRSSHLGTQANGPAVLKCFMVAQSSCAVLKAY